MVGASVASGATFRVAQCRAAAVARGVSGRAVSAVFPRPAKLGGSGLLVQSAGMLSLQSRVRGCLLGGAIGDALGAPVEFMRLEEIKERFGPDGITDYAPAYGRIGGI